MVRSLAEGTFFIGIDFRPQIEVLESLAMEVSVNMPVGFEFTATTFGPDRHLPVPGLRE